MSDTGYAALTASVEKTNEVLREIEREYGWPKERRQQSYAALRTVLQALRDRLAVEEAADLAAQLPMVMRGLFFEGWRPSEVPVRMSRAQFLERVRQGFRFETEGGMQLLVQRVLHALRRFVTNGEWDDVRATLPDDFTTLLPT
jgi:uncharacterized protein (DUF2267 family)